MADRRPPPVCGALSYGALTRLIPDSGGEYLYLSRVIHPSVGFVAGWISLLAGFTGSIAYAALTFAAYAMPVSDTSLAPHVVATLVIVVVVLLHALRLRQGAWAQNSAVAFKFILMLGFCVFATFDPGVSSWVGLAEVRNETYEIPPFSIPTFALSLMWISFSYLGFNAAVYLAGEVPSAQERIPRALMLGSVPTILIYLALNAVFVLVPPFASVALQEDVAAVEAEAMGGHAMANAVHLVVALTLFTSVSAIMMVGPRVYAKMADDGLFPPTLRFKGETPMASIVMQDMLTGVVVWITGLRELLSYLSLTLGLSTAATVAAPFVIVRRDPSRAGALPGSPWAPTIFVLFTLLFAALSATVNP